MNELNELEKGIADMKKSSAEQKRIIQALKDEKTSLIENSRLLNQRLIESHDAFEKTSRKIIDFMKDHINEIKLELGSLESKTDKIPEIEKDLSRQTSLLNKIASSDSANLERLTIELESLRKESDSQKNVLDTLKINLFSSLERSIAALKKDLEENRKEDIDNSLREFKSEIKRITNLEEMLDSSRKYIEKRLDVLQKEISDIDSAPIQIKEISKKLSETTRQFMDSQTEQKKTLTLSMKENGEKMERYRDDIYSQLTKSISDVQGKLDNAMKYVEKKTDSLQKDLSDVKPSPIQIRELSQKLTETRKDIDQLRVESRSRDSDDEKFLAELNKSTEFIKASLSKEEEKTSDLFKRVISLENTPPQVNSLKTSLSELRSLYKEMNESTVSQKEFNKSLSSLSKSLSEIHNIQMALEKSLSRTQSDLQSQISTLLSDEKITKQIQKHVQDSLDQKIQETNQDLRTDISTVTSATNQIHDQLNKSITNLTQEITDIEKTLSEHSISEKSLQKNLTELSRSLSQTQDQLNKSFTGLSEEVDEIEKRLVQNDMNDKTFSHSISELQSLLRDLGESSVTQGEFSKSLATLTRSLSDIQIKQDSLGKSLLSVQSDLQSQIKDLFSDEKVTKALQKQIQTGLDQKIQDMDLGMQKDIDRISELTSLLQKEMNKSFSGLSNEITQIEKTLSEQNTTDKTIQQTLTLLSKTLSDTQAKQSIIEKSLSQIQSDLQSQIKDLFSDEKVTKALQKQIQEKIEKRIQEINQDLRTDISGVTSMANQIQDQLNKSVKGLSVEITTIERNISEQSTTDRTLAKSLEGLTKSFKDLQSNQSLTDKSLSKTQLSLQSQINDLLSEKKISKAIQASVQNNLDQRIKETNLELEKRLAELIRSDKDNSESILMIKETLQTLKPLSTKVRNNDLTLHELSKSISSLMLLTKNLPSEITRNLEKIDKLEESKLSVARQLESLETGSRNFSDQLSTEKERTSFLEKSLRDLSGNHEKRMDRIEESLITIQDSPNEIESIRESLKTLNNDISSLQKLTSQITGIQKSIDELEENLNARASDSNVSKLSKSLSELTFKMTDIDKKLYQKNATDKTSQQNIDSLSKTITNIQEKHASIEKTLHLIQSDLQSQIKDLFSGEQLSKALQKQIQENIESRIKETSQELRTEIESLSDLANQTRETHSKSLTGLSNEMAGLGKKISEQEVNDRGLKKNVDSLFSSLKDITLHQDTLEKSLNAIQSDFQSQIKDILSDDVVSKEIQKQIQSSVNLKFQETNKHLKTQVDSVKENAKEIQDLSQNILSIRRDLISLQKTASEMSNLITEKEFGQTINNISKRIQDLQDDLERLDSKTSLDKTAIAKEIQLMISNEKFLERTQARLDKTLDARTKAIEANLKAMLTEMKTEDTVSSRDINAINQRLEAHDITLEKISAQEEAISQLKENFNYLKGAKFPVTEKDIQNLSSQISKTIAELSSVKENAEKQRHLLSQSIESSRTLERTASSSSTSIKSLNTILSGQEKNITRLQTQLSESSKKQKEMMDEYRRTVDKYVKDQMVSNTNENRVNEMSRSRSYDNLVKKFNTQYNKIQSVVRQAETHFRNLSEKEKALVDNIAAENAAIISQMNQGQENIHRKLENTDKFIMHMNNQVTKMKIDVDKLTESRLEKKIAGVQKEAEDRERINQKVLHSRLNEMDKKMANLMSIVGTWKKKQQLELVNLLKEEQ